MGSRRYIASHRQAPYRRVITTVEFLLAIGVVAGLFWAALVLWRGELLGGALLVLLTGSCFGFPFFNVPLSPVPLTIDRLLLAVLVTQYLVYRHRGLILPKPLSKPDYLLVAFLLVLAASTLTHDFQYRKWQPLAHFVFFYFMPAVMYVVARQIRWTARSAGWLFGSLAIFGVYLAATAVAETHQWWDFVFPRYIGSSDYQEFLGRGRGPFLNPAAGGIVQASGYARRWSGGRGSIGSASCCC